MPGPRAVGQPAYPGATSAVPPEATVRSWLSPAVSSPQPSTARGLPSGLRGANGRYLLRSSEAALRQSSRKQNSGYWRQISRPTSSRSRCFNLPAIVRIQDPISVHAAEDVPPSEAEGEDTPTARRRIHIATHHPASPLVTAAPGPAPKPSPRVRSHRPQHTQGRSRSTAATLREDPGVLRPRHTGPATHWLIRKSGKT